MGISTGSWSISSLLIMITILRTPPLLVNWALWVVCGDIPKWQFWKFIGFWGSYPTQKWILKPCWTQDIWTIQNGHFEGSGWKALAGASSGRTSSCDLVLDWAPAWDPKTRRQDSARAEPSLSTKNVVKPIIKLPNMDPFGGSSLPAIDGDITVGIVNISICLPHLLRFFVYPELGMTRSESKRSVNRGPCRSTHLGGGSFCINALGRSDTASVIALNLMLQPMSIHEHKGQWITSLVAPAMNCFTHAKNCV